MELVKLPNYQSLDPVEFLYECLVSEAARRQTRKVATRNKKSACFYPDACIENTLYAPDRNLNRGLIERLAACVFVALTDGRQCFPAANTVAPQVKLVPVSTFIYRAYMSKSKKKTVVRVKLPRTRNLIAKALCSDRQFQGRIFVNKKKELPKFDWRKDIG